MEKRQQAILEFIHDYPYQYPPTIREIGAGVGLRSSSSVHQHLIKLEGLGYIERRVNCPRSIVLVEIRRGISGATVSPPAPSVHTLADGEQPMPEPIITINDVRKELSIEGLESEIECLRKRMNTTALEKGISHPEVLSISRSLDKAINEYVKLSHY